MRRQPQDLTSRFLDDEPTSTVDVYGIVDHTLMETGIIEPASKPGVYRDDLSKLNADGGAHIRLLFCPRSEPGCIRHVLKTVSLHSAPKYSALSYSWTYKRAPFAPESARPDSSLLDFQWTDEHLQVSSDLQHALECLLATQACRWLWVDAICINQANAGEKSDQVTKMRAIYEGAQNVFVWLGPERGNVQGQGWLRTEVDLRPYGLTGSKLTELLQQGDNAWWLRLWIIQEIVSAAHVSVVIGRYITPWEKFIDMICTIPEDVGAYGMSPMQFAKELVSTQQELLRLRQLRNKLRSSRGQDQLLDLLRLSSFSRASDPKDKVYGLLGLAKPEEQRLVEVNYSKSTAITYSNAVRAIIEATRSLNALIDWWPRGTGPWEGGPEALPSWVHNFAHQVRTAPMPLTHVRHYRASGDKKAATGQSLYPLDLDIEVVRLDTVAKVAKDIYRASTDRGDQLGSLAKYTLDRMKPVVKFAEEAAWADDDEDRDPRSDLGCEDAFWRVLVADRNPSGHGKATDAYRKLVERLPTNGRWLRDRYAVIPHIDGFLDRVAEALNGRSFFATKLGFLGLGPEGLAVGDLVVVPFGANVPFAVREVTAAKCFKLIGDCFCHGVMYGELMELLSSGEIESEWITLV